MAREPLGNDLPTSPEALRKIANGATWEAEARLVEAKSNRRAWWFAGGSAVVAVCGIASATAQALRPAPEPTVLVVDRTTGETMTLPKVNHDSVPEILAMDLNNAAQFVVARETYSWSLLRKDYDQVARMSTTEVFAPYQRQFTGPEALQDKLGDREMRQVTVINARPVSSAKAGRSGEVIVTYEREVRSNTLPTPVVTRHVATVRYEYRPGSIKKDKDRIWNPFGFVVTAYRSDAEVAPSRVDASAAGKGV